MWEKGIHYIGNMVVLVGDKARFEWKWGKTDYDIVLTKNRSYGWW